MLETTRLWLVPVTLGLVEARLRDNGAFVLEVGTNLVVSVEPPWPGDAIVFFDSLATRMRRGETVEASFAMVDKATLHVIGMLGCVELPKDGVVEIGYGINPGREGSGLTTEAVAVLVHYLHSSGLHAVRATTAASNVASRRVLEKTHFQQDTAADDKEVMRWIHSG